jgi:hypothetical protein
LFRKGRKGERRKSKDDFLVKTQRKRESHMDTFFLPCRYLGRSITNTEQQLKGSAVGAWLVCWKDIKAMWAQEIEEVREIRGGVQQEGTGPHRACRVFRFYSE